MAIVKKDCVRFRIYNFLDCEILRKKDDYNVEGIAHFSRKFAHNPFQLAECRPAGEKEFHAREQPSFASRRLMNLPFSASSKGLRFQKTQPVYNALHT